MPQKMRGRRLFFAFSIISGFVAVPRPGAQIVPVGKGSYAATLPSGRKLPADSNGIPVEPQVTPDFKQPVTTNEWWSSFLYKRVPNQHGNSGKSYPHPLSVRGAPTGLELGYPDKAGKGLDWEWEWAGGTYEYPHAADLVVGIEGLNVPICKTAGYSDWAVTADWTQGALNLRATLAHGNPYAFFEIKGGNAKVTFAAAPAVWLEEAGVLGVTVNGHHYGIFAPTGSAWAGTGNARVSSLAGKGYLSVGILPDGLADDGARKAALALFRAHAYAFLVRTRAGWAYDEKLARVTTTLTSETVAKEGTETRTLQAMYRHQWLHSPTPVTAHTYASPRGLMRLMEGNVVTTILPFHGILPNFPDKGYDKAVLQGFLNAESGFNISDGDTYGAGKSLGRAALLVPVADQAGNAALRDALLAKLKAKLQAWFTAAPGKTSQVFHYSAKWNILFGYPASFHSDDEVNDHHFHYGYFILTAATVARYDPAWASAQEWGGMVDLLIRDVANADDADTRFARLRNFDPYAGHSWAHGSEYYGRGNNQESSSEAMNFHTGLFLWALAKGDKVLRDQAIWMYANEAEAVQQYWFDAEEAVFPDLYPNPNVGQVLSAGGAYWTFFGAEANWIHGINFLPLNSGSTYLGWYPANIKANVAWMYDHPYRFKGKTGSWDDVIWGALAFADPADAARRFGGFGGYGAFDGESKAHIYHLVKNLEAMGTVQRGVLADAPSYAVFDKAGTRTYAAYNPDAAARTVLFNDGTSLAVGPRALVTYTGPAKPLRLQGRSAGRRGPTGRLIAGAAGLRRAAAGVPAFSVLAVDGHEVWNSQAGALPPAGLAEGGLFILKREKGEGGNVAEE